jgi:hypothetical protein
MLILITLLTCNYLKYITPIWIFLFFWGNVVVILNINGSKQFCVPPTHIHFTYIKVDVTYVITIEILLCHKFDQNLCNFLHHHHLWIRLFHFVYKTLFLFIMFSQLFKHTRFKGYKFNILNYPRHLNFYYWK